MSTPILNELAGCFEYIKLQVTVQLQQATVLPDFKGSLLHGWFGHVLKAHDEHAYFVCYGEHDQQQPKPYMICPNADHKTDWKRGELIDFELCLFGSAVQLAPMVIQAIDAAQHIPRLGLGCQRTAFTLLSIASYTPLGLVSGVHATRLSDWLKPQDINIAIMHDSEIAVNFITPVRMKYQGQIIKQQIPNLHFLVNQILRRFVQLSRFWAVDNPELFAMLYKECMRCLPAEADMQCHCYFEDWQRYSLKQQQQLPFGGLKGQVSFYGELHALLPLFKIGELLHIGGKTTFGLGSYQLIE